MGIFISRLKTFFTMLPIVPLWLSVIFVPKLGLLIPILVLVGVALFYLCLIWVVRRKVKRRPAVSREDYVDHPRPKFRTLILGFLASFAITMGWSLLFDFVRRWLEIGGYTNAWCWYLGFALPSVYQYLCISLNVFNTWYFLRKNGVYLLYGVHDIDILYAEIDRFNNLSSKPGFFANKILLRYYDITQPIVRNGKLVQLVKIEKLFTPTAYYHHNFYLTPNDPAGFTAQANAYLKQAKSV